MNARVRYKQGVGLILLALAAFTASSCADATSSDRQARAQFSDLSTNADGKPTLERTRWKPSGGKSDSIQGRPGLPTSVDNAPTAVWEVNNAWDERDSAAGIAWGRQSGLTWNQKFRRWVDSLQKTEGVDGYTTFELRTPYGKTVQAPVLECAEVAIFLRVAFANWYDLPFFLEARDSDHDRLYFGHFGIRTRDGRWRDTPKFKDQYVDFSYLRDQLPEQLDTWPSDEKLRDKGLLGADDDAQPMIGPDAEAGAYFDEIFLNKRVGHFLAYTLIFFGSTNLADSVNTFNIPVAKLRPGTFTVKRTDFNGVGHVRIVMERQSLGYIRMWDNKYPHMRLELASGSMPRRQPRWGSAYRAQAAVAENRLGGDGYRAYGGGFKHWRVAKPIDGRWTNSVPRLMEDDFIATNAQQRLANRPEVADEIVSDKPLDEQKRDLIDTIQNRREQIQQMPSTCANRISRENAFEELYLVGKELGMSREDVDRRYRQLQDYIFAELEYDQSKTCCWLSTNREMYEIIMQYNRERIRNSNVRLCMEPDVFKAVDDGGSGYERYKEYAESIGRGDDWVDWSAGESCPQREFSADTEAEHNWTPACEISGEFALYNE